MEWLMLSIYKNALVTRNTRTTVNCLITHVHGILCLSLFISYCEQACWWICLDWSNSSVIWLMFDWSAIMDGKVKADVWCLMSQSNLVGSHAQTQQHSMCESSRSVDLFVSKLFCLMMISDFCLVWESSTWESFSIHVLAVSGTGPVCLSADLDISACEYIMKMKTQLDFESYIRTEHSELCISDVDFCHRKL